MEVIRKYVDGIKAKNRADDENRIRSQFKVVERNGKLWLTHSGVAFMQIPADATADGVAKMLDNARGVAVEYEEI